ncbi:MAG: hypothetical protein V3V45_02095 [Candidatus Brocadiales bacterium]
MIRLLSAVLFVLFVFTVPAAGHDMPDRQTTLVTLVLDRTGSMDSCREQVISGFNEYIETLKKTKDAEFLFTLILFDKYGDEHLALDIPYKAAPLNDVKPLTLETYVPRGLTPLYDAIGYGIQTTEQTKGYDKTVFVIMTDGEENSSKEFSREQIFKKIEEKKGLGNWTFAFLGAGQDAYANSAKIGISAGNTLQYQTADTEGTFKSLGAATSGAAASPKASTLDFFGPKEKEDD